MSGSLVADLGIGPEIWLFLSLLCCVTLFFKFSRIWSVRNLDLLLLFALAPGMMGLVGNHEAQPWSAFVWLFLGSALWLVRCLVDLGLPRRPLLEPNLNAAGLACLSIGVLGLLAARDGQPAPLRRGRPQPGRAAEARSNRRPRSRPTPTRPVKQMLEIAPLPGTLRPKPLHEILARVLASLAHLGLVAGLIAVGWRHFERPIAGLAVATCYLLLPYTRMALVDSGQLVPAALVVGGARGLQPAGGRGRLDRAGGRLDAGVPGPGRPLGRVLPGPRGRAVRGGRPGGRGHGRRPGQGRAGPRRLGPRAGGPEPGRGGPPVLARESRSPIPVRFWAGIDASYRLPVLIAYLALVLVTTFWPAEKNLGELIALSAALLVASQFWYPG